MSTRIICSECAQLGLPSKTTLWGVLKSTSTAPKRISQVLIAQMSSKCPVRKEAMKAKIDRADAPSTSQFSALPTRATDSTQSYAAIARETAKLIRKDVGAAVPTSLNTKFSPPPPTFTRKFSFLN